MRDPGHYSTSDSPKHTIWETKARDYGQSCWGLLNDLQDRFPQRISGREIDPFFFHQIEESIDRIVGESMGISIVVGDFVPILKTGYCFDSITVSLF